MAQTVERREHWASGLGFVLAAAGSAIGLGNIWKFPYITGENGGGAFVLVYLVCIAVIGLPVMLCEITIGRHTQRNPVGAFQRISPRSSTFAHVLGAGMVLTALFLLAFQRFGWAAVAALIGLAIFRYGWVTVGALGVLAGFTILSFYSVVAGWTIGYMVKAAFGLLDFASSNEAGGYFAQFVSDPMWSVGCHFVFILLCVAIVYKGVQSGIERWSKILMPILFLLLIVLIIRSVTLPGAVAGVRFFLSPDFSKLTGEGVLIALGHAFFSLSLGMGAMITYGSYVGKNENIFLSSLTVTILDTLVAMMAGLAIFPAVFAMGFQPEAGPGLLFKVLPLVFHKMAWGPFWATLFFLLVVIAALTSGISLLEVVTAYFVDERGWSRRAATILCGLVIFELGALCAVSVGDWRNMMFVHDVLVKIFGTVKGSFFDVLDHIASNWMLPLGGMLICIFTGWIWGTRNAVAEIRHGSANFADVHLISLLAGLKDDESHNSDVHVLTLASLWGIFIRFISPVAVLIAFLHGIGWIDLTAHHETKPAPPAIEQSREAGK